MLLITNYELRIMSASTILFDLDGTLTDPKPGITRCIQFALSELGHRPPDADELHWCIGPPIKDRFSLIGYITVHWLPCPFRPKLQGYISELFIQKTARGQGIGKTLLATVISEAKIRECSGLMLLNHKERESYQREFYRKQGWLERETVANFIYPLI
ncbi:GNAT family N-acetyltransferase [Nostoc sp. NMS7]|uniref:GNAT family N-acetyltransferase n=1 Tax=Nostoc sp. NMS7 TaxID=2815391 RepID=UPI0025F04E42|nr:GNAT family N-acetyltransferase [Nostoc sp. NMS7]